MPLEAQHNVYSLAVPEVRNLSVISQDKVKVLTGLFPPPLAEGFWGRIQFPVFLAHNGCLSAMTETLPGPFLSVIMAPLLFLSLLSKLMISFRT